jgi:2-polyprenyl-3-methyl-5-hydroxy-6-metoxy-1,4-benzoquinol methylase
MLVEIAEWGRRKKISMELLGVDANPHIINFAKSNAKDYPEISFVTENILSAEFRRNKFDIVLATLFTHHFTNEELGELLKSLHRQSSIGIVINDLHRHWLAYHSISLITKWFSKSSMVQYDAPVSVLRSFSRPDLDSILHSAGISNYALTWKWAFRWQLIIQTSLA